MLIEMLKDGLPIDYLATTIYDYQIDGIRTLEEAEAAAERGIQQMLDEGYAVMERGGEHYFDTHY